MTRPRNRIIRQLMLGAAALAMGVLALAQDSGEKPETEITDENVLEVVDANGNGRITCAEARKAGVSTPVPREHPAYKYMRDGDGDGQVCE